MVDDGNDKLEFMSLPLRMHPRVFAALGADLVTNDVVAVIELVKNSYDAFARNVWVRFGHDPERGEYIEVEDDGQGMTQDIIEDVWCVVATPFKEIHQMVSEGKRTRRVVGEKGLGRLSVARLGDRFNMITQAPGSDCLEVEVDWADVTSGEDVSESFVRFRALSNTSPFKQSGTLLRIYDLWSIWDYDRVSDLEENLARLISPFREVSDFNIFLSKPGELGTGEVRIVSPEFLNKPKYAITGEVDDSGSVTYRYRYSPVNKGKGRKKTSNISWQQVYDTLADQLKSRLSAEMAHCGGFSFDIRAWDITSADAQEIGQRFNIKKSRVRDAIKVHKGISVYRDGVLVLPKTENARDWLGLDLRRVSRVGTRLSTNQLVGYVSISADRNPRIEDTSDRERLVSRLEVSEFEEILKVVISILENERDQDRVRPERVTPLEDLFESLKATEVIAKVEALAKKGADATEVVPILEEFDADLDDAKDKIQKRFVFYSRLATVGTIAQMLVHEIRNKTTAFGSYLKYIQKKFGPFTDDEVEGEYKYARESVRGLEQLADTFSPLASRAFRRRKRDSILEKRIQECINLQRGEIERKGIKCIIPDSSTRVAVDPGELDSVLLNLITNATYWLNEAPADNREISFQVKQNDRGDRVRVWVHDSGPGIREDDLEKIFWPGITNKPGGIGMGLTVASELVSEYEGRMAAVHPGVLGGATFVFDLPIKNE